MVLRPHRACLGGAGASAPDAARRVPRPHRACQRDACSAPTELVSVERALLHQTQRGAFPAPTELVSVERGLGDKRRGGGRTATPVQKPSLHRDEPGGGGTMGPAVTCAETHAPPGRARWGRDARRVGGRTSRHLCRDPCSTGTSPVGAGRKAGWRKCGPPSGEGGYRGAQKNIRERGCPRGARDNTPLPEGSVHNDPPAKGGTSRKVGTTLLQRFSPRREPRRVGVGRTVSSGLFLPARPSGRPASINRNRCG